MAKESDVTSDKDSTLANASIDELMKYEEHKDSRQLKNWVIKTFVFVIAVCFVAVCLGFVFVSVTTLFADSKLISDFLATMTEVMKLFKS